MGIQVVGSVNLEPTLWENHALQESCWEGEHTAESKKRKAFFLICLIWGHTRGAQAYS